MTNEVYFSLSLTVLTTMFVHPEFDFEFTVFIRKAFILQRVCKRNMGFQSSNIMNLLVIQEPELSVMS